MTDEIHRFSFTHLPVRGQYVHLTDAWHEAIAQQDYDLPTGQRVGEFMALAALLADGIKFDGKVALQASSNGRISTLLGECHARHQLRGIARINELAGQQQLEEFGSGRLAISLIPDVGTMHQGVVELVGGESAAAIEHYFNTSEQIPTRVMLAVNAERVVAMLLQRMPQSSAESTSQASKVGREQLAQRAAALEDDWQRLQFLFASVTSDELLSLQPQQLLHRLFHTDSLTLHPPRKLKFHCSCSRERSERALKLLGKEDLTALSNEADEITVSCEMCGAQYLWDGIEAHVLFETQDPQIH